MSNDQQTTLPRKLIGGVWELAHHTLMMVGLFVVAGGGYLLVQPQAVAQLNQGLTHWVMARKSAAEELQALAQKPVGGIVPVAAAEEAPMPSLTAPQKAVSTFLARRYSIAPAAMAQLVEGAWTVGKQEKLDPLLILAVISVESSFNPYAQSSVGATGLMQVMANVHRDKFEPFGGPQASLDPLANIRVGAVVLRDAIQRGGSVRTGLRYYVGASTPATEGGYADKVLAAKAELDKVAGVRPAAPQLTAKVPAQPATQATTTAQTRPARTPAAAGKGESLT